MRKGGQMPHDRSELMPDFENETRLLKLEQLHSAVLSFNEFGKATETFFLPDSEPALPVYVNEFWTSTQRAAHRLHEISYRACFKPQLPRFFITRLTVEGDVVYDPFMGRGTTALEAALLNRVPFGCDINPLSSILTSPRLDPPELDEIQERLQAIDLEKMNDVWDDLLVFYHPETLRAITNLRGYLLEKERSGDFDRLDAWIRMVATNRLTGHSRGFFSVYTMPPNQSVSVDAQRKINARRLQGPPLRDVKAITMRKSRALLSKLEKSELNVLRGVKTNAKFVTASSDSTPQIEDNTVRLVVTSPPFLDNVAYHKDNWLRCWFNGVDADSVNMWHFNKPDEWQAKMAAVFQELKRILMPGGYVAFEVGEVRGGKIFLETLVVPAALAAGLTPEMVIVNSQVFTKTAHCWGVDNQKKGTNTNRIVILRNPQ